jgi:hypothetical protein
MHSVNALRSNLLKNLTVRNVPSEVAEALDQERRRRGDSLNKTVIDLLRQGLGLGSGKRSNGLASLAGTWSEGDSREFENAVAVFEQIDEELWR